MQTLLTGEMDKIPDLITPPAGLNLQEAVAFLNGLVREPAFLAWVLPLLRDGSEDWYVAHKLKSPDRSYSLQVFVWPPGKATKVHDHASWGAYACAFGTIFEQRYERLDDGSLQDHARLRKSWERAWNEGDDASTVLPYDGGIHSVGNRGAETAISVHLYGPRMSSIDGRDYDPSRDYVCDRLDD